MAQHNDLANRGIECECVILDLDQFRNKIFENSFNTLYSYVIFTRVWLASD